LIPSRCECEISIADYFDHATHKPAGEWKRMFIVDDTHRASTPVMVIFSAASDNEEHLG